ncbi:MAG: TetR/AcrR family transcriptional regulator [Methyloprofundus sp.]|nr:TetR/AcrR family transcriptional regulator [Methyloprofundus sp.]
MARRSEHSRDEIKLMVLEAAENIVREQGFTALKIRQICADMGYTVASVYMVFDNMDDLNTQIKTRTLEKIVSILSEKKECLAIALAYLEFVSNEQGLSHMLLQHQALKKSSAEKNYDEVQTELQHCFYDSLKSIKQSCAHAELQRASSALMSAVRGSCLPLFMQDSVTEKEVENNLTLLVSCFLQGWRQE